MVLVIPSPGVIRSDVVKRDGVMCVFCLRLPQLPRHKSVVVRLNASDDSDSDAESCSPAQSVFGGLESMIKEARRTVEVRQTHDTTSETIVHLLMYLQKRSWACHTTLNQLKHYVTLEHRKFKIEIYASSKKLNISSFH